MSEFHVQVVRIGKVGRHPNADTLSITHVLGDYPVIFRTGEFNPGDLAVYVPVDAVVPAGDPFWEFLRGHNRIKAKRLRGVFSMGVLCPSRPGWVEGQNVQEDLGVAKYEPPLGHVGVNTESEPDPGFLPVYTDIEGLRRYPDLLRPEEPVLITEKIHGANGRWPDVILYGEVYGKVQDLHYGTRPGETRCVFFDAFDLKTGCYMNPTEEFPDFLAEIGLPHLHAPLLYQGYWVPELCGLAEGKSAIPGAHHVREGFVVRPQQQRWCEEIGRVILKLVGEEYLTRKEK